ncbi:ferritin-like domain-containing protein, partial [Staphylococcus aureus]|uniref:ferritin-like domain-containing protein n=1 Tax=Staphylococcus aureus TaxID=1280 RepID=UPI0011A7BCBB
EALNHQINHHYFPPHPYIPMPPYCHKQSYQPFPNFFIQQPKQQPFHPQNIYNYINHTPPHPQFTPLSPPKIHFSTILQTFKHTLSQQQQLTTPFYNLSQIPRQHKHYPTISFLNSF